MSRCIAFGVLIFICGVLVHAQDRWISYEEGDINCTFLEELIETHEDRPFARVEGVDITLQTLWQAILEACSESSTPASLSEREEQTRRLEPAGTFQDPLTFNKLWCVSEDICLAVYNILRPADKVVTTGNLFNSKADAGHEYVLITLWAYCPESRRDDCKATTQDFELVGSLGTKYATEWFVSGIEFDIALVPGGEDFGVLTFQVRKNDSQLKLLHKAGIYSNNYKVYEAEPSESMAVKVTSETNANVRTGPGTDNHVIGTFPTGSEDKAYSRNSDGSWLKIMRGWVYADLVNADGDIMELPVLP